MAMKFVPSARARTNTRNSCTVRRSDLSAFSTTARAMSPNDCNTLAKCNATPAALRIASSTLP